jgi:hypothetical protein
MNISGGSTGAAVWIFFTGAADTAQDIANNKSTVKAIALFMVPVL